MKTQLSKPARHNAFIESFWSSLKYELVYHHRFATLAEVRIALKSYGRPILKRE